MWRANESDTVADGVGVFNMMCDHFLCCVSVHLNLCLLGCEKRSLALPIS